MMTMTQETGAQMKSHIRCSKEGNCSALRVFVYEVCIDLAYWLNLINQQFIFCEKWETL